MFSDATSSSSKYLQAALAVPYQDSSEGSDKKYVEYSGGYTFLTEDKMEIELTDEHKPLKRLKKRKHVEVADETEEKKQQPEVKRRKIVSKNESSSVGPIKSSEASEDDDSEDFTLGGFINDEIEYETGYTRIPKHDTRTKTKTKIGAQELDAQEKKSESLVKRAHSLPGIKFKSLRMLNNITVEGKIHVVGRDEEEMQIFRMLAQPSGLMRPLLIGPSGIGKKAIIRKIARSLQQSHSPKELQGRSICMIDSVSLLANELTDYARQELAVNLRQMIEKIIKENKNPIFYFRDIDKLLDIDTVSDYLYALFSSRIHSLASISGNSKSEEVQKSINKLKGYKFEPMIIEEMSKEDAKHVVESKLKKYPLAEGLKITPEAVQFAVDSSHDYIKSHPFPMKALHIIHEASINILMQTERKSEIAPIDIATILEERTGIAAQELLANDLESLQRLEKRLSEQVVGQDHAIKMVCEPINNYKMGLSDPDKPVAALIFVGSSGVGKTELAKCTAEALFHGNLVRIDMSEYAESYTISRLIGSPPGYMNNESGGLLTNAIRKNPHCVVLFDEIEKAHIDVRRVLLQLMDEGRLTDGRGDTINCKHTLIIMTSNLGAQELYEASTAGHLNEASVMQTIEKILVGELSPEFYNRLQVVPFSGLRKEQYPTVIEAQLKKIERRLSTHQGIQLKWDKSLIDHLLSQDFDPKFGMRSLCKFVEKAVKLAIQHETFAQKQALKGIVVLTVKNGEVAASSEQSARKGRDPSKRLAAKK